MKHAVNQNLDNTASSASAKQKPQVSIGMPVYNGAKFIREALDSLLAQTFTDFELTISDNASTDGTEAICREYAAKDQRIRYVRQPENLGAAANFRFVLDEAVGEYFMWAAADDLWVPNFIYKCQQMLTFDKDAGMAMMAYVCTSRFSSLFNRSFDNPLTCISIVDKKDRVRAYSMLSFKTHKDNLVYAVWRKKDLSKVLSGLAAIDRPNIIGAAMNEFSLALFRGVYIPDIGFYKRYKYLPPGHFLDPLRNFIFLLKKILIHKSSCNGVTYSVESHLSDLKIVLQSAGFSDDFVSEVVDLNILHTNT